MRPLLVLTALLAGCSLVARFDVARTAETTESLCADGLDNDGDGLTDCQDFKCLPTATCCNLPVIVLADDFAKRACAAAACSATPNPTCALDPALWSVWGTPLPQLCNHGLSPYKSQLCYEVGALSTATLPLHSGLNVTVGLAGVPEIAGRLIVGLTLQGEIVSGSIECDPVEGLDPVAAAVQGRTENGYVLLAEFENATVGASPEITDDQRHELKMVVGTDRIISWLLDGVAFARSPDTEPLPAEKVFRAHLGLAGRGLKARFLDVRVTDGTQCDAPGAWKPGDVFQVLSGTDDGNMSWDSFQTFNPAVARNGDQIYMYYSGCTSAPTGEGCGLEIGAGVVTSSDGVSFVRAEANPLEPSKAHTNLAAGTLHNDVAGDTMTVFLSNNQLVTVASQAIFTVQSMKKMQFSDEKVPSLNPGPVGAWDDSEICCASVFQQGNQLVMWFAGHAMNDPTWRIGLARSFDGGISFLEDAHNPVLVEGNREEFDGRGVTDPEVIFDEQRRMFRLWYTGLGSLGRTSIGYALSTDGLVWHKFPGNPVLSPEDVGLETLGSPAVLADEGQLQMFVHGRDSSTTRLSIYNLVNRGLPPE